MRGCRVFQAIKSNQLRHNISKLYLKTSIIYVDKNVFSYLTMDLKMINTIKNLLCEIRREKHIALNHPYNCIKFFFFELYLLSEIMRLSNELPYKK